MDLLNWVRSRIATVGPAEFTRQLNEVADLMQVRRISLEAVLRWHRGEVRQLSGRSRDLITYLHAQSQDLGAVKLADPQLQRTDWFISSKAFIMAASECECIELLSVLTHRLEALMFQRTTAIATLIRSEFLRQNWSVDDPDAIARFTQPAGRIWAEGDYPQKLRRLLDGTLPDAEIDDTDLDLIAACLRVMTGNALYSSDYIRAIARRN